jgi:ABC-2 type transport system permease protein
VAVVLPSSMTVRRYLRMLAIFYKSTLITEMEYRLNFWSNIGLSLFWLVWAALGVRVFFFHTDQIAGWNYNQLLVVVGLFFAMNGYRQAVLQPNLGHLSEYVRLGSLDYVLTRPIDSQFLVSLRFIGVYNWGDPLLGLGLIAYACWRLGYVPSLGSLALFALLCLAAMVLMYSLYLMVQTTTFWLVNIERADAVIWSLVETARFPVNFYRGWVGFALTAVVPVALLTTFPAQALLGRLEGWIAVVEVLVAALLFVLARAFWRFALRHYSGASS